MPAVAVLDRWVATPERHLRAEVGSPTAYLRVIDPETYPLVLFTEIVNKLSNIDPNAPTQRLPIELQTDVRYQPITPLLRFMRTYLDRVQDLDKQIEKVEIDERILADENPRYPDHVKMLLQNCVKLVRSERERESERRRRHALEATIHALGWDLP